MQFEDGQGAGATWTRSLNFFYGAWQNAKGFFKDKKTQ